MNMKPLDCNHLILYKNYDILISPVGECYSVKMSDEETAMNHESYIRLFAQEILNINIDEIKERLQNDYLYHGINLSYKDILINYYGFVSYQHKINSAVIKCPDKRLLGLQITEPQVKLLEELILINGDPTSTIYQIFEEEENKTSLKYWR